MTGENGERVTLIEGIFEVMKKFLEVFGKIIFYTLVHFIRVVVRIINAAADWLGGLISKGE